MFTQISFANTIHVASSLIKLIRFFKFFQTINLAQSYLITKRSALENVLKIHLSFYFF